jgi:hypothetical protein
MMIGTEVSDEALQPRVCVRNGVGKVNGLVLLLKEVLELQLKGLSLKAIPTDTFHPIHLVAVLLPPFPALALFIGLKPASVQVLLFAEVADVELHLSRQISIADLEVVPTGVPASVCITAQE